MLVARVMAKPTVTGTPPVCSTPAGWVLLASGNDGSGLAQAADTGQVWGWAFTKIAILGEPDPAFTITNGDVCFGYVTPYRSSFPGAIWSTVGSVAGDTTSATTWATVHAGISLQTGDALVYAGGAASNAAGASAFTLATIAAAATGFTFANDGGSTGANTNNGNDMSAASRHLSVATGTLATVTVTVSATLVHVSTGVGILVRLRDAAPPPLSPPPIPPARRVLHIIGR